MLFLDDSAAEFVLFELFFGENFVAPCLELRKSDLQPPRAAAIEPHGGVGEVLQETPVMADDDQSRAQSFQLRFEPSDGGEIEMIGRLVEQQNIGRGRECARKRRAPRFAAGKLRGILLAREAKLIEIRLRLMRIVAGREASPHVIVRRRVMSEIRLLREITDGRAWIDKAAAAIGLDQTRGDFEQSGFARAVAADQAHLFTGRDGQIRGFEQGRAAEGQRNVAKLDQGWSHERASIARGKLKTTIKMALAPSSPRPYLGLRVIRRIPSWTPSICRAPPG